MSQQINTNNYKYKSWSEKFPDGNVKIESLFIHSSWKKIFDDIKKENSKQWNNINSVLTECLAAKQEIYPYPDLVFNAFNLTSFDDIKVCIIGQDPYYNSQKSSGILYPEAMGLSFSLPIGLPIPSSLKNIFNNAVKFKHFDKYPSHGNLQGWADQGCLLMNTALTVIQKKPNIHAKVWNWLTNKLIEKISENHDDLVFVLWGAPALKAKNNIDDKHNFVISSHPSGLSCNNKLKTYLPFVQVDHFKEINDHLEKAKLSKINWKLN
jgi:uracil-DNA glycosylase